MLWLWQLEDPISAFVEVALRNLLSILSVTVDVNIFKEEMGWKGIVGGYVRPVKAMVPQVAVMCTPPHFYYPPNQLWATAAHVPMVAWPTQASCMPRWVIR